MLLLVVAVVLVGLSVTALLVLAAASAAEQAVRLAGVERRRDHWRRLGEASQDVQRAADDYQRAMALALERNGGNGDAARRAGRVGDAARDYQDACRRLARVLAGGPRPPRSHRELALLMDDRRPEPVAAARPADNVVSELADLQDSLDTQAFAPPDRVWRIRAALRMAVLSVRARAREAWRG